ncbi:MAG: hypothetical protein D4R57_01145 [Verrucomicrobiales bacterium]|nr:MAG: hypothetical protein D4R57_01145 [Verrucomicrobiales bacterium]
MIPNGKFAECACGCETQFHITKMEIVWIDRKRYLVHPKHKTRISKEVGLAQKLENTLVWLYDQPIIVRWKHAEAVYRAQIELRTQLEGEKEAIRKAKNAWWMLVLPIWFTTWLKSR